MILGYTVIQGPPDPDRKGSSFLGVFIEEKLSGDFFSLSLVKVVIATLTVENKSWIDINGDGAICGTILEIVIDIRIYRVVQKWIIILANGIFLLIAPVGLVF